MTMKLVVGSAYMLFSMVIFPLFAFGTVAVLFLVALGAESIGSLSGAALKRSHERAARTMAMHI